MYPTKKDKRNGVVPPTTRRTFLKRLSGAAVSSLFIGAECEKSGSSSPNPDLNIVDARSIVTVDGPSFQQGGTVADVNKVIICGDIVATDAYCAQRLADHDDGFYPERIRSTLARAEQLGLGTADLSRVRQRKSCFDLMLGDIITSPG